MRVAEILVANFRDRARTAARRGKEVIITAELDM